MTSFSRNIWLAISVILLAVLGILFQQFVYRGVLDVQGIEPPFHISIADWGEEDCLALPCKISLPPNTMRVEANKTGYSPETLETTISFQKESALIFSLIKTPELLPYTGKITPLSVYEPQQKNTVLQMNNFSFSGENLLEGEKIMTSFSTGEPISVASDEVGRGVWAFSPRQIFFVSTQTAQKQIAWEGDIRGLRPLFNGDTLVLSHSGVTYLPHSSFSGISLPSAIDPNLSSICETGKNELFGFQKTFRGTEAVIWNTKTAALKILSALKDFPDNDFLYAQCIAPHQVVLVFQKAKPLLLVF
ncbi:MAG: hypothetical protein WCJ84_02225 [Candidatus Peregrinibacteria bacterium]